MTPRDGLLWAGGLWLRGGGLLLRDLAQLGGEALREAHGGLVGNRAQRRAGLRSGRVMFQDACEEAHYHPVARGIWGRLRDAHKRRGLAFDAEELAVVALTLADGPRDPLAGAWRVTGVMVQTEGGR